MNSSVPRILWVVMLIGWTSSRVASGAEGEEPVFTHEAAKTAQAEFTSTVTELVATHRDTFGKALDRLIQDLGKALDAATRSKKVEDANTIDQARKAAQARRQELIESRKVRTHLPGVVKPPSRLKKARDRYGKTMARSKKERERALERALEVYIRELGRAAKDALGTQSLTEANLIREEQERREAELEFLKLPPAERMWRMLAEAAEKKSFKETGRLGGKGGAEYRDFPRQGGLLVGLEVIFLRRDGFRFAWGVKPIFRTAKGEQEGVYHGGNSGGKERVMAKAGYAVGGVTCWCDSHIVRRIRVRFMKIIPDGLDTADFYESEWIGEFEAGEPQESMTSGGFIIGVAGRAGAGLDALGLLEVSTRAE